MTGDEKRPPPPGGAGERMNTADPASKTTRGEVRDYEFQALAGPVLLSSLFGAKRDLFDVRDSSTPKAMVTLLQAALGVSDEDAVEFAVVERARPIEQRRHDGGIGIDRRADIADRHAIGQRRPVGITDIVEYAGIAGGNRIITRKMAERTGLPE